MKRERARRKAADVRKYETAKMAKNSPDIKAIRRFGTTPCQQPKRLIRAQGEQKKVLLARKNTS